MLGSGVAATMIVEAVQAIGLAAVEAVVDPAVSERDVRIAASKSSLLARRSMSSASLCRHRATPASSRSF